MKYMETSEKVSNVIRKHFFSKKQLIGSQTYNRQ